MNTNFHSRMNNPNRIIPPIKVADSRSLPIDTISQVKWHPGSTEILAVSSWDGSLRVFEIVLSKNSNAANLSEIFLVQMDCPVLSVCWESSQSNNILVGLLDGSVIWIDSNTGTQTLITKHNFAIKDLYILEDGLLSVDCHRTIKHTVKGNVTFEKTFETDIAAFTVDKDYMIIAFVNQDILFGKLKDFKARNLNFFKEKEQCEPLCVSLDISQGSFLVATNENRVYLMNLEDNYGKETTAKTEITFRCHSTEDRNGLSLQCQINCCVLTSLGNFSIAITGGGNGDVIVWNINEKSKPFTHKGPAPVVCFDYNQQKKRLAVGYGYDWARGFQGLKDVRTCPELEVLQFGENDFGRN